MILLSTSKPYPIVKQNQSKFDQKRLIIKFWSLVLSTFEWLAGQTHAKVTLDSLKGHPQTSIQQKKKRVVHRRFRLIATRLSAKGWTATEKTFFWSKKKQTLKQKPAMLCSDDDLLHIILVYHNIQLHSNHLRHSFPDQVDDESIFFVVSTVFAVCFVEKRLKRKANVCVCHSSLELTIAGGQT